MSTKHIQIDVKLDHGCRPAVSCDVDGYAYLDAGFLYGAICGSSGLSRAESTLVAAFDFTGCPLAAREERFGINPWRRTGGAYRGSRVLQASDFRVTSSIQSSVRENTIRMALQLYVSGPLPRLIGFAEPFQEKLWGCGPGLIQGEFAFRFVTENGQPVPCAASTEYELSTNDNFGKSWRNITIQTYHNSTRFEQVEQIDLFESPDRANDDLALKVAVAHHRNSRELELIA